MSNYRRVPISKMSKATLLLKQSEAEKRVQELKQELVGQSVFESEKLRVDDAIRQIALINEEISAQTMRREASTGLMGALFGVKEVPHSAIQRIAELRNKISGIENSISRSSSIVSNQNYINSRLITEREWLENLSARIQAIEKKEAKQQSLKNKAAEGTKSKRQIAKGVRKSLADNNECPYCGISLVSVTHADHIYPLAMGGESTKKNMVLVCYDCNTKKGALTLRAFIKKHGLDRDAIEKRLESLGKDF